ncbi:C4b-binding protein alpha chain-like [Rhinophrynus dorsalis]
MPPLSYSIRTHCALLLVYLAILVGGAHGDCGPPPVIDNTDPIEGTFFSIGESVTYSCDRKAGYYEEPEKSRTITCQEDSTWSEIPEFCIRACDSPPRLEFAELKQEHTYQAIFRSGDKVQYICRPGYIRVPGKRSTLTCLADFMWSLPETFCIRRSCGFPGDIENGKMEANEFIFGSRVNYYCNEGYNMISKRNYRDCQADGTWSNTVPECEVQTCLAPEEIVGGSFSPQKEEYQYQDSVTYKCNGDLALLGSSSIFCTDKGIWSSEAPQCKVVECPVPNVPNSRKLSGTYIPYLFNYVVRFACLRGYAINGSDTIRCNIDSQWEPPPPECLKVCDFPPNIPFGKLKPIFMYQIFYVNTTVEYDCRPGYERDFNLPNTIYCVDGFKWSKPAQFCKRISCGDPGEIENGEMEASDFLYESRVYYKCNKGYYMASRMNYRICKADGTWSNYPPKCEVQTCEPPKDIINGTYSPKQSIYQYQNNVTYKCNKDLALVGNDIIFCKELGYWSSMPPECKGVCGHPPSLDHAELISDFTVFTEGMTVEYVCVPGYEPIHQRRITTTCLDNLTWSPLSKFCKRKSCGKPREIKNGEIEGNNFLFESRVTYICNKGYKLSSEKNYRECQANGTWSNDEPECEVQTCSPPNHITDGSYSPQKDKYQYQDSVQFKCNKNLELDGEASLVCSADGNWSSDEPQCIVACRLPPKLEYGKLKEDYIHKKLFPNGTSVEYVCQPGFEPISNTSSTITCLNNLTWTHPDIFCKRINCGTPGEIINGEFTASNFLFESKVSYTCKKGYTLISRYGDSRQCQADGTWSNALPTCEEDMCDKIWSMQESLRKCTAAPDDWIKYLQVQYLYLQIENLKLDIEEKKKKASRIEDLN